MAGAAGKNGAIARLLAVVANGYELQNKNLTIKSLRVSCV